MKKLTHNKFSLPQVVIFVLIALIIGGVGGYKVGKKLTSLAYYALTEKVVADNTDKMIRYETQTAVSMLSAINKKAATGELTPAYANKLAADLLRDLRYGDDQQGYFWADTTNGVNVVLYGRTDVEGKNRYNDQIDGINYIQEIIAQGQKPSGGYTDYFYPKLQGSTPEAKRAYSLLSQPYQWVVGTGYYLNDIKLK
ncbi:cache domain-containing protein [Patescibacteria group bacterium]|nr:cache domain-containing protein [Patescibacteria group bacterium]